MYRRIVVPVQGGRLDEQAIDLATAVTGRGGGSEITLVYVVEVPQELSLDTDMSDDVEFGEQALERAGNYAQMTGENRWLNMRAELLQARSAAAAIVDEAIERGADAIVLAATNRRELGSVTQGETVPYVLKNAPCDVILIRTLTEESTLP